MALYYSFNYQSWLSIQVSVRKPTFSKHPAVSISATYRGSTLYTEKEKIYEGLLFEKFSNEDAIIISMATLGRIFSYFGFVYEDYPDHLEHDNDGRILLPYKHSRFPIGSVFEVVKLYIDSNADIYYLLDNSEEGLVMGDERILRQFPEIMAKYSLPITWDDSGPGYLSKKLLGKKFKILKFGYYYEEHKVIEI